MQKKITTRIAEISYYKDRILRIVFPNDVYVSLEDTMQIHEACEMLTRGQKYLKLVIVKGSLVSSREAREYRAILKENDGRIAEALVYKSYGNKLVLSFYLNFNRPEIPTKLFTSEERAEEWLKGLLYLTENNNVPVKRLKKLIY